MQRLRVACKDWNDIPAGPENWMRIHYAEEGTCPNVRVSYLAAPCWHCQNPVCIPACPVKAIVKHEEDGIVVVDAGACQGNTVCADVGSKYAKRVRPAVVFKPKTGGPLGEAMEK